MKIRWPLAVALLALPAGLAAQVEIGVDAGYVRTSTKSQSEETTITDFDLPVPALRFGFAITPYLLIEPIVSVRRTSFEGASSSQVKLTSGVSYLFGPKGEPQFYARGEAGLLRIAFDSDRFSDNSNTQYLAGGAVGVRVPIGAAGIFRVEGDYQKLFEASDVEVLPLPSARVFSLLAGVSLVVHD